MGSGGVGKTTVSAALAIAAALEGQKVLVMTIDPARRLADALGMSELGDEEFEVPASTWTAAGLTPKGQLFGMMLNQKLTFDQLVERFSPNQASANTIKENRWYQQMSTALAGAQDYMAIEKLYEMVEMRDYDLIVLDTPPTSNALDFLEAPERIKGLLGIRSVQWVQEKLKGESKASRLLRWGGGTLLKALGRVTGKAVIEEVTKLLDDLSVLYDSFRDHADAAWELLRSQDCRFLQVSSPRHLSLQEALFVQETLLDAGMRPEGFLLNRTPGWLWHQGEWRDILSLSLLSPEARTEAATRIASGEDTPETVEQLMAGFESLFEELCHHAELAQQEVVFLHEHAKGEPFVLTLPAIAEEIGEMEGVARLSRLLLEDGLPARPSHPAT
jgi:anion-transporting  ArsA/GET3 family ATPase